MKKIISVFLAVVLVMSLAVPAFAEDPIDPKFTFDLTAVGEYTNPHDIEVETGTVITVRYSLSADTDGGCTALTQDEIYYDTSFFEFVPDSARPEMVPLDDPEAEAVTGFDIGHHQRLDTKYYVFFNNGGSKYFDNDPDYAPIGSFQLKVIAERGYSIVQSTSFGAKTLGNVPYKQENFDLKVTVAGSKEEAGVTISGVQPVAYGETLTLTASAAKKEPTGGTWSWTVNDPTTFKIVSGADTDTVTVKALKANTTGAKIIASYEDDTYGGTADVTVKPDKATLTPAVGTVSNKTYDGTTAGEGTIKFTAGVVGTDAPTASGSFAWTAASVGTSTVDVTGIELTGAWGDNYTLDKSSLSNQAAGKAITAAALTITDVAGTDRPYNGTTSVELTGGTLAGVVTGDTVTFDLGTGTMADANVGTNKPVTTNITLTGTDAANYTLTQPTDVTVDIAKADQNPSITPTANLLKGGSSLDLSTLVSGAHGDVTFEVSDGDAATLGDDSKTLTPDAVKTGEVKITVNAAGDDNYNPYTGTDAITVTVQDKADANVTITNAPAFKTYGDRNFTVTANVTNPGTNGKWTWESSDSSILQIVSGNTATATVKVLQANANGATLTVKYESDTTADTASTMAIPVAQKTLTITGVAATGRAYKATTTSVELTGGTLVGVVTGDIVTFDLGTGTMADANVGTNKAVDTEIALTGEKAANYTLTQPTVKVTITKADPNCVVPPGLTATFGETLANVDLTAHTGWSWMNTATSVGDAAAEPKNFKAKFTPEDTTNYNTLTNLDVPVTVDKAAARTLADQPVTQRYNLTDEQNKSLAGLMPRDAGTLNYTGGNAEIIGVADADWSVAVNGKVTYTIRDGAVGNTVTLPVTISSTNYEDSIVKVVITLADKDPADVRITNAPASKTYGDADFTVTAYAAKPGTGTGTWTWTSSDPSILQIVEGDKATAKVKVLMADATGATLTATYSSDSTAGAAVSMSIPVNKAKPAGTPQYTRISEEGKTLADAQLAPNANWPEGTIAWNDAVTTPVEKNVDYGWTFIPTDGDNYETATGTLTPWARRSSGDPSAYNTPAAAVVTEQADNGIVPVSGTDKTIKVEATVTDDEATLKIDTTKLDTVVDKDVKTDTVKVDLTALEKDITGVVIPNKALQDITNAAKDTENDVEGLAIQLTDGTVKFDTKALESIAAQVGSDDLKMVVDDTGIQGLKTEQVTAVQESSVLAVYDIYMTSNGKRISNFDGGAAEVTVRHKLEPGQKTEGLVVLYVADDGTKTPMEFTIEGDEVVFTVTHFSNYVITYSDEETAGPCPQDETCVYAKYTDSDTHAWYHDGVHYCVEKGYMIGFPGDVFKPNAPLSRAQIVTILWRMEGSPVANYAMSFQDVAAGKWYTEAIRWAQSTGVVLGYNDEAFGPNDNITREQLAAILNRYAAFKGIDVSARATLAEFTDAGSVSAWAVENVRWANAVGMVTGRTATTLVPRDDTTRAEAATMIQRFCESILK